MKTNGTWTGRTVGLLMLGVLSSTCLADGERSLTDKTGHRYASNVSETTIDDIVAKGYRMTDIEVVSTGPHRYTASFVRNSGSYQSGWWWKANQSEAEMTAFLTQKEARIIDIETYFVNGKRRYAFVALPNPSREFKAWWWFADKSWDEMKAFYNLKNGRLIDVDVEKIKGKRRYSGIVIPNTGQDHKKWRVFSNIKSKEVRELLDDGGIRETKWRLVDLERLGSDRFAGLMEESEGQAWWWFTNKDWEEVKRLQGQYASRIFDIERHTQGNKVRFDILVLNNSNPLEWRMGQWLRGNSDGTRGFMLKEVNGPTLGSILPDFRTYPASTNKVLQHYYWSARVGTQIDPLTVMPLYTNHTDDTHDPEDILQWSLMQQVTQWMMWNSGNTSSNGLQDLAGNGNGVLGRKNINEFGWNVLGLTDDFQFFHKYADGADSNDPANRFTMRQITKLYEAFGNGVGLNNSQWDWMHDNMLNRDATVNPSFRDGVRSIMDFEGQAIGLTINDVDDVWDVTTMVWKPGNVSGYSSAAGWIRLPYKTQNGIVFREFALGGFIHDFTVANDASVSGTIMPEILRDEIADMLETWI
jgi:hypothetical protein